MIKVADRSQTRLSLLRIMTHLSNFICIDLPFTFLLSFWVEENTIWFEFTSLFVKTQFPFTFRHYSVVIFTRPRGSKQFPSPFSCKITKSKRVMEFLRQNDINVMEWPTQSSDLNPIENLWKIIGDRAAENQTHKTSPEWCGKTTCFHSYRYRRKKMLYVCQKSMRIPGEPRVRCGWTKSERFKSFADHTKLTLNKLLLFSYLVGQLFFSRTVLVIFSL